MFPESNHDDTTFPETPSTRLTSKVLSTLLPLLSSKEKTVRYRSTQIISHIINSLDSIDDDLFSLMRLGLLRRIRDKESMVRVQAVLGLGRLAGNEADGDDNDDEDEDDARGLLEKLLEVLQNDSSADVRRSLLLNLPLTPETLPFLLERARDQDPATRRALYSRLLPALGDFRHLSLSMREKLLRWGLRDRDENVRKAAGKLFRERWIEDCAATKPSVEGGAVGETPPPSFDGLLELLERIDVVNSGLENGVALEAMKGFWEGRGDYREAITFDESFWDSLSAESVFMARSFNDFCRQEGDGKYENLVDEKLPEVTALAFFLHRYINALVQGLKQSALSPDGVEGEEDPVELEFIVEQLLHIALTLDYSDEVGRRKMFSLLREILALPELPEEVTRLSIEVLRGVCGGDNAGEREFCGVVLEAVAEVHDTIMGEGLDDGDNADDSFHSARSELSDTPTRATSKSKSATEGSEDEEEKAIKEIMVNMKCLHIARCMLESVSGNLQSNIHLVTMLNNLVVPAVRSHEAPIRERGLLCLGLCCLLDRGLAEENLTLFLHCYTKGHDALQVSAIQIISDILLSHGPSLLNLPAFENGKPFYKVFAKALKADDRPQVQAASSAALCKLMLSNVIKDEDLLKTIVVAYFDPSTAENLSLRQGLNYFLPVYCYSRKENQERMQGITVPAIHSLGLINENMDEEEDMVSLSIIAAHLVDWTDPRKLITAAQDSGSVLFDEMGRKEAKALNCDIHLDLAKDVLEKVLSSGVTSKLRSDSICFNLCF
jgi:condensin complex subunit 3